MRTMMGNVVNKKIIRGASREVDGMEDSTYRVVSKKETSVETRYLPRTREKQR